MYFDRKDDIAYVKWAKYVKQRDGFCCQICERRGVILNSHHQDSWDWCEDGRYDIDNGICLCNDCHQRFHQIYGFGQNTRQQFREYQKICESLKSAVEQKIRVESAVKRVVSEIDGYVRSS